MANPTNTDNVIDSREIIERLEELRNERDSLREAMDAAGEAWQEAEKAYQECQNAETVSAALLAGWGHEEAAEAYAEWAEENSDELRILEELNSDGENTSSDWTHGETMIHESYFVEFCREFVSDIGDMPKEIPSYIEIDWEKTADNIRADYSEIDFDGQTYLIRHY
jgi:hypothetical protein